MLHKHQGKPCLDTEHLQSLVCRKMLKCAVHAENQPLTEEGREVLPETSKQERGRSLHQSLPTGSTGLPPLLLRQHYHNATKCQRELSS